MKNVVRYEFPVENNIDLLRLLAALQVMLIHAMHHLHKVDIQSSVALAVLDHIPGVPLFFFLSGLLIMKSYDRAESFRRYAKNRFLRLYPALWICVALSLLMLVVTGYLGLSELSNPRVIAWLFTQATFLQFYNPEIFYDFGVGVINGSLWTISVEFQFYLLAPILYFLYRFKFCYISLFILSISANILLNQFDLRCSIPDDHMDPRRSAFFMARSILRDIRSGVRAC